MSWLKDRFNQLVHHSQVSDVAKVYTIGTAAGTWRAITGDDRFRVGYGSNLENSLHKWNDIQGIVGVSTITAATGGIGAPAMAATSKIWQSAFPNDPNYSPNAAQLNAQAYNNELQLQPPQGDNLIYLILAAIATLIIFKIGSR